MVCRSCKNDLPETDFYVRSRGDQRQRRQSQCKACNSKYMKNWVKTQAPDARARRLAMARENWFQSTYGISVADYDWMFAAQGGVCASCHQPAVGKGCAAILNVDHDHETGAVRALLCTPCNRSYGLLKEDPDVIWGLLIYARRHQKRNLRLVA